MRKAIVGVLIGISFLALGLVGCNDKQVARMNFFSPGIPAPVCDTQPEEPVATEAQQIENVKALIQTMVTDILVKDFGIIFLATVVLSFLLIASYIIARCMRSILGCIIVFLFQFGVTSINLYALITNTIACDIVYILLGALIIDVTLAFVIGTVYWIGRFFAFVVAKTVQG